MPPLVAAYAEAFAEARARGASRQSVLSIERFADATRAIQLSGDPTAALGRLGIAFRRFPPRQRALDAAHDDRSRSAPALPRSPRRVTRGA